MVGSLSFGLVPESLEARAMQNGGAKAPRKTPISLPRRSLGILPSVPRRTLGAGIILSIACILCLAEAGFSGPPQAASAKGTMVSLGTVSSAPKGQVIVPVFLTPGSPETQVGSISAAIRFDSKAVSFQRAEKGFLLDGVNAALRAEVKKDSTNPDRSVIELEVSTGGENRKALREGLVLSLLFRVEAGAAPDTNVTLTFDKLSAATPDTPPKPIAPLVGQRGTIEILQPEAVPYVGCFFFTH